MHEAHSICLHIFPGACAAALSEEEDIEWKQIPKDIAMNIDDPERVPIPDLSALVDRSLKEEKSHDVWDLVSAWNYLIKGKN